MSEFVSSEIAHKLKEKGFPLLRVIKQRGEPIIYDLPKNHPNWQNCNAYYIPTIAQVLKWLREQKKLNVEIFLYNRTYSYYVKSVTKICEDCHHQCLNDDTTEEEYDSYEEAALAGIEYVLDNLI